MKKADWQLEDFAEEAENRPLNFYANGIYRRTPFAPCHAAIPHQNPTVICGYPRMGRLGRRKKFCKV